MWVRGLKRANVPCCKCASWSHPMWVRGLKLVPFGNLKAKAGRTLCGCVD